MPQNAAYAISSFKMSADTAAINGSGEQRSVQVLEIATIWLVDSSGVRNVSTGESGGITKGFILCSFEPPPLVSYLDGPASAKDEESRASTLEWKCGVVIGLVIISYLFKSENTWYRQCAGHSHSRRERAVPLRKRQESISWTHAARCRKPPRPRPFQRRSSETLSTVFSRKSKLSRTSDRELDGTQSSCGFSKVRKEHTEPGWQL